VKNPEPTWRTESACEWCQDLKDGKIGLGLLCCGCGRRVLPPRSRPGRDRAAIPSAGNV